MINRIDKKDILLIIATSVITLSLQNLFFTNKNWVEGIVEDCSLEGNVEVIDYRNDPLAYRSGLEGDLSYVKIECSPEGYIIPNF